MKAAASLAIVAAAIVGCVMLSAKVHAIGHVSEPSAASHFVEPIVAITFKSKGHFGAFLENPVVKKVGERSFLVGQGVCDESTDTWQNGRTVWVAIDEIEQLVELDSTKAIGPRTSIFPAGI